MSDEQERKDQDLGAGLIHQAIPDGAGSEPRPNKSVAQLGNLIRGNFSIAERLPVDHPDRPTLYFTIAVWAVELVNQLRDREAHPRDYEKVGSVSDSAAQQASAPGENRPESSSPSVIAREAQIKEARAQLLYDIAMGICAVRGDSSCPIGDYAHQVDTLIAAVSGQQNEEKDQEKDSARLGEPQPRSWPADHRGDDRGGSKL